VQYHNYQLNENCQTLKRNNITVYSVKTDAFTIHKDDVERAQQLLDFGSDFGQWRVHKNEEIVFPTKLLQPREVEEVKITEYHNDYIELTAEEEYDTVKICNIAEEKKRLMNRADLPGSGKSYWCEHMRKLHHNVMFVCPTNHLAKKYINKYKTKEYINEKRDNPGYGSVSGITFNKFFGIAINDHAKLKKFDDSDYDVIVFEEIFFYMPSVLITIKHYCDANPDKIIIANGDTDQLPPVGNITTNVDFDEYRNHCINMIFQNLMNFKENKRLKLESQKKKLKTIKEEIFNKSIPVEQTIKKYFKLNKKIICDRNIAYENKTCAMVAKLVRKRQKKVAEFEEGDIMICRKYFKCNKNTFNVNYTYTITNIKDGLLIFDDEMTVPIDLVRKNFIYDSCQTCHSMQGSTTEEKIMIFDWKHPLMSRKWLWVAITRTTNLDNVIFYDYTEKSPDKTILHDYIDMKIRKYLDVDASCNRNIKHGEYLNRDWFLRHFGTNCQNCREVMCWEIVNNSIYSDLTVYRTDDSKAHNLDNIQPLCRSCYCEMNNIN